MANAGTAANESRESNALLGVANRRLYPPLRDPNFLVLRSRRIIFQRWIDQLSGETLSILDVGGRYQPYRPLFGNRARRYTACDIVQTELVDVVGNGECLPFAPESFDVVVATQVFEYFVEPQKAAREIHTVLKKGGTLLASMACVAPRFSEHELWRLTPTGIQTLLSEFSQVTIVPETSSAGGLLRTANLAACAFGKGELSRKMIELTFCSSMNLIGLGLERITSPYRDQFTSNYSVRAIK